MKLKIIFITLLLTFSLLPASAQKIYVDSSVANNDFVGNRFVFSFKEQIRKSTSYTLLDNSDGRSLTVELVTLGVGIGESESAISVLVRVPLEDGSSFLLEHQIIAVGTNRIEEMSSNLLADVDRDVSQLKSYTAPTSSTQAPTHH